MCRYLNLDVLIRNLILAEEFQPQEPAQQVCLWFIVGLALQIKKMPVRLLITKKPQN